MRKTPLIIGIIVIIFSCYYAFSDISLEELKNAFQSIHYIYLIPSILLIILSFVFKAIRWRYLIRSVKEVKTVNLFSPLTVGFMGNMLPARAGEFIRAYLLGKREDISFSTSFATIVIERLFDLAMVLLLLFWVILFNSDAFLQTNTGDNHKLMSYIFTFGLISFVLCLLIFIFAVFLQYKKELAVQIVDVFTKHLPRKWGEKISAMLISFTEGLSIIKDKSGFIASIGFSLMSLVTLILFNYPLYFAFEIQNILPLISSLTILYLIEIIFVALFPTPGFLGAFQAAYVIALHEIFNIPKAVAASFGIIAWLASFGPIIVAGAFFVIRDNISLVKISKE